MLQPVNRCIHFMVPVAVLPIVAERTQDEAVARSNPEHVAPAVCGSKEFPFARPEERITPLPAYADA